jgi:hypothetical protein
MITKTTLARFPILLLAWLLLTPPLLLAWLLLTLPL